MENSQGVRELIMAAKKDAKTLQDSILKILELMEKQNSSDTQIQKLQTMTKKLESVAVDTLSIFEARMQYHFRRGPFPRKLKSLLLESQKTNLADRVHQYYLAINVLKHGKGKSYRELLNSPNCLFTLKSSEGNSTDNTYPGTSLIDVTVPDFFDGLVTTILEAYHFLENR